MLGIEEKEFMKLNSEVQSPVIADIPGTIKNLCPDNFKNPTLFFLFYVLLRKSNSSSREPHLELKKKIPS